MRLLPLKAATAARFSMAAMATVQELLCPAGGGARLRLAGHSDRSFLKLGEVASRSLSRLRVCVERVQDCRNGSIDRKFVPEFRVDVSAATRVLDCKGAYWLGSAKKGRLFHSASLLRLGENEAGSCSASYGSSRTESEAGISREENFNGVSGGENEEEDGGRSSMAEYTTSQEGSQVLMKDLSTSADSKQLRQRKTDKELNEKDDAQAANVEKRRRRKSVPEFSDLRTVPGIGLKTLEKLKAKGILEVAGLKQLYLEKFGGDGSSEEMAKYLRSDVGVMKNHAAAIANFVRKKVEEELQAAEANEGEGQTSAKQKKRRLTFCVEGNISVGKTTFLQKIADQIVELRDLVEIVPEPVGKWQDIGEGGYNILDAFYTDPRRYAYTFQNYVFVTRMMQEKESSNGLRPLRLMERSVFSDRMVFVRAVHEAKWMDSMELSIYDSWFDPMVSTLPGLVPDGFIYLRAEPGTCHKRLQTRARGEEAGVSLEYLIDLHEKHEQWLLPAERAGGSSGLLGVSQWRESELVKKPDSIDVVSLRGDHVHSSIREVPALVLDCDNHIDFTRDLSAQAEYARQVADFFEYVTKMKEAQEAQKVQDRRLVVSGGSSLIIPSGSLLRKDYKTLQHSRSFI